MADEILELCKSYTHSENIGFFCDPDYYFGEISLKDDLIHKKGEIQINTIAPPRQQILTLMHEVLHMHPKFADFEKYHKEINQYFYNKRHNCVTYNDSETKKIEESYKKYIKLDRKITRFAKHILRTRPDILRFIAKNIGEAYILDEKRDREHQEAFDRGDIPF